MKVQSIAITTMHKMDHGFVLPAEDRDLCRARMRGEGVTRGSVEEGGIYRELTVIEGRPAR